MRLRVGGERRNETGAASLTGSLLLLVLLLLLPWAAPRITPQTLELANVFRVLIRLKKTRSSRNSQAVESKEDNNRYLFQKGGEKGIREASLLHHAIKGLE